MHVSFAGRLSILKFMPIYATYVVATVSPWPLVDITYRIMHHCVCSVLYDSYSAV